MNPLPPHARTILLLAALTLLPLQSCKKKEPERTPEQAAAIEARKQRAAELREWQKKARERREASKDRPPVPSRCTGRISKELRLVRGETVIWTKPNTEVVRLPGSVTPEKRGKPLEQRTWIAMENLIPAGEKPAAIEMVPCRGEPFRIAAADLTASPGRFRLSVNRRGMIKLMDMAAVQGGGTGEPDTGETDDEGDGTGPAGEGAQNGADSEPESPAPRSRRRDVGRNFHELRLVVE